MIDTIFALSSGLPPAGIAVVRVSGPRAGAALEVLAGKLPVERIATVCRFRVPLSGATIDTGLALWFPGPASVTGEDLAELHLHGGRAVVAAVLEALGSIAGLRFAVAGEFTRRAFENGRIDLAEAEGLADLLAAETEGQRRAALALAEGGLGRKVAAWQADLLQLSARVEADLDFSDEGDVEAGPKGHTVDGVRALAAEMAGLLADPPAERLRDGVRVVLAGPPNSGKSSLFNALIERDAAIVTDVAGTTRDRIEAAVVLGGVPLILTDTAGLRGETSDSVEAIGIARTGEALAEADIILWLGEAGEAPDGAVLIAAKSDLGSIRAGFQVSSVTGVGLSALRRVIVERAQALLPQEGTLALNARHRAILRDVVSELEAAAQVPDALMIAEHLRYARTKLDALTGKAGVEDMLDALFGAFCIGK
jgi:tRNA modification GTPase